MNARIEHYSSANPSETKEELEQWQSELAKLRRVQPSVVTAKLLKENEIPALQKQIADETTKLAEVQKEVEEVS